MQSSQSNSFKKYTILLIVSSVIIRLLSIGTNDLLVEEAYYWNYAQHLDYSYLDHPPMVALLIRLSTLLFGNNEFAVRIPALLCWSMTALFSFKLSNRINSQSGIFALLLLAVLPFFFLQSLIMTPDLPLMLCWSAVLFYLYETLILKRPTGWYRAGLWLGLGMLSKYTIFLLVPATLLYLIWVKDARQWFTRKEPYIGFLISTLLFTPVIYWNATHQWASFAFQSTRRLQATSSFSFHELLGLLVLFLTPLGIWGLSFLLRKKEAFSDHLEASTLSFLRIFTLVPLGIFSLFSFYHEIKFNWIGPGLLAMIPWLAFLMNKLRPSSQRAWFITSLSLLSFYGVLIIAITLGRPEAFNRHLLSKYIAWQDLAQQVLTQARKQPTPVIIVPLDLYNMASELRFYQNKLTSREQKANPISIVGRHVFGQNSLMYQYWSSQPITKGTRLMLLDENPKNFERIEIRSRIKALSPIQTLWAHSQGKGKRIRPYFYQLVTLNG